MKKSEEILREIDAERRRTNELHKELGAALREEAKETPQGWLAVLWADGSKEILPVIEGQRVALSDPEGVYGDAYVHDSGGRLAVTLDCDGYWEGGHYLPAGVQLSLGESQEGCYFLVAALTATKKEAEAIIHLHRLPDQG